jgi:DNA modification methylase
MDKQKLKELEQGIDKFGQLQPGVCRLDEDGQPVLIVGERRLRSCEALGIKFKYTLKEDMTDEADVYEIELIENILREDLSWQDRSEALLRLHELRQSQKGATSPGTHGGHGIRDTAKEVHISVGSAHEEIELALYSREVPEVANAASKSVAKNIIRRLKEEYNREEALDEAIASSKKFEAKTVEEAEASGEITDEVTAMQARLLEFDRRILEGTFEYCSTSFQKESFDVVCFDPPWSVNYDKVMKQSGNTKEYKDESEIIERELPKWIRLVHSLMTENSHLYLFFGIVYHEQIYTILESNGFTTNRMPIFWKKRGAHRTRAPKVWPGRCYEAIAYGRKGTKDLAQQGRPDIVETPMPTPKMKLNHPSAKHPDIYKDLLQRSCSPGELVLDPMCGSGMFGVAAEALRTELSLDWYMIEADTDFRNLALHNLMKGYSAIVGDDKDPLEGIEGNPYMNRPDEPPPEKDYTKLEPGSEEWKKCWQAYPEQQDEMLEWRANQ